MPHPHGSSCRCASPNPDDGLLAYTVDCEHYEQLARVLAKIADKPQTATLRVLTTETPKDVIPLDAVPCDGTMTCGCEGCTADRISAVRRGVRPSQPLPLKVRKAA